MVSPTRLEFAVYRVCVYITLLFLYNLNTVLFKNFFLNKIFPLKISPTSYISPLCKVYKWWCNWLYCYSRHLLQVLVEALHGSHVFCLSSHVRWRCAGAQRENTKRILLLFSYGNIICQHLQICFFLDYITWWIYILSHFGSILLCNSNPDADR